LLQDAVDSGGTAPGGALPRRTTCAATICTGGSRKVFHRTGLQKQAVVCSVWPLNSATEPGHLKDVRNWGGKGRCLGRSSQSHEVKAVQIYLKAKVKNKSL